MDCIFTQMAHQAYQKIAFSVTLMISFWVSPSTQGMAITQSDYSALDSTAAHPTLRIRSFAEVSLVDSVLHDSLWVWIGPCDGPIRSFRFEFPDSTFCCIDFPCLAEGAELSNLNSPLITNSSSHAAQTWTAHASIVLSDVAVMPRIPIVSSCFPPASKAEFERLIFAMHNAVFETDKCLVLEEASAELCLTRHQMSQALRLIPSEDRRLEVMKHITRLDTKWTELELHEMFQLNFIFEQALKRFTKR